MGKGGAGARGNSPPAFLLEDAWQQNLGSR